MKLKFLFLIVFLSSLLYCQSKPLLYFCERYDVNQGEINQGTIFSPGQITVMVRSDNPISETNVYVQFDKLNLKTNKYEFYLKVPFTLDPRGNYFYFPPKNTVLKVSGHYRCYLVGSKGLIATASVEIE